MGRWVQQIDCETRALSFFPSQNGPGLWWVVSCCIMPLISWVDCFLKQSLAKELSYQSLESALVGRDLGLVNSSFRSSLKIHWRTRPLRPRYHNAYLQICLLNIAKIAESGRNGKHWFQRARAVGTKDTSPHWAHSQRPFTCRHTLVSFVSRSRCYLLTPDALYWLKTPLLYRPNIGWALSQYAWRVDPITLEKMFCKEHQQAPNDVLKLHCICAASSRNTHTLSSTDKYRCAYDSEMASPSMNRLTNASCLLYFIQDEPKEAACT